MPALSLELPSSLVAPMGSMVDTMAFAQAEAPPVWFQFVPLVLIFGIFWVVVIRPARKKQDELQQTIANLKKGDRVVTTGGIYGEVAGTDTAYVVLKIADNLKIKVARSAIAGLQNQESGANR